MSSARKQGETVHSEAREVIASVVKLCDEEGRRKQLKFPLTRATDRAARCTGVSTTVGYARTNVIGSRTSFVIASVRSSIH
jgi:hypothetical protein